MNHKRENILSALRRAAEEKYYYAKAVRQIEQQTHADRMPLLVHTMGKVGSSSTRRSLRASDAISCFSIYGTYFLSEEGLRFFRQLEEKGRGRWVDFPRAEKILLTEGRALADKIAKAAQEKSRFKVVSLVRDPVATNISAFFQKYGWWPRWLYKKCKKGEAGCVDELVKCFMRDYPHSVPLEWWDMELKTVFGVDVLATPFPKDRGYEIYRSTNADVLIMKLEKLRDCFGEAFREFMGVENLELIDTNVASRKWYSAAYSEFRRVIDLPQSYLDTMYGSQVYKNFYSLSELDGFRQKWSQTKEKIE